MSARARGAARNVAGGLAALAVVLGTAARAEAAPSDTGWAGAGAGIGFTLAAAGLSEAIATDVIQSNGGDSRALGAATLGTFCIGIPVVELARGSTTGHGSLGLQITGYLASSVALGIGAYLLGRSLSTGESYPSGLVTGLGAAGAAGLSLLSVDALLARSDAMAKSSARTTPPVLVAPTFSVTRAERGGLGGSLGVVGAF